MITLSPGNDIASPSLKIGGVPLVSQNFYWGLTAGVTPFSQVFRVPNSELADSLNSLSNPVTMEMQIDGFPGQGGPGLTTMTFENLFLEDIRRDSAFESTFRISDIRYSFRGKKLYFAKNITRVKNEKGLSAPPQKTLNIGTVETDRS